MNSIVNVELSTNRNTHIHCWLYDSLPRKCRGLGGLVYVFIIIVKRAHCIFSTVHTATYTVCSWLLWWASMTQHKEAIITTRSQSAMKGVTHHYCKHKGTQQIHPEDCPGSLLCQRRCLRPGETWAGSHSFSLGYPGCPSSHIWATGTMKAEDEWLKTLMDDQPTSSYVSLSLNPNKVMPWMCWMSVYQHKVCFSTLTVGKWVIFTLETDHSLRIMFCLKNRMGAKNVILERKTFYC